MIRIPYLRHPLAQALAAVLVAGGATTLAQQAHAATAAGTPIKNLATVTYEDANGNVYSSQSNEAIVTVAQVFSATIGTDVDAGAAASQTVYLPYVLHNTGNGADSYDLSVIDGITGGDSIDAASLQIFEDVNGNGEPDAGENPISVANLAADQTMNLVVAVQVPATATDGQTIGITLSAIARDGTAAAVTPVSDVSTGKGRDALDGTNESLITVTGDAVLVVTKTAVPGTAPNTIDYTVSVRNNGNRPARDVVLFDGLPAGTAFVSSSVSGLLATNGDVINASAVALNESTLPNGVGTGVDLNADNDTGDADEASLALDLNTDGDSSDSGITGVYAIDAELPANSIVSLSMTVSYDPGALGGGYVIENRGHAAGDTNEDGTPDSLVSSNTTQTTVTPDYGVSIADTGTVLGGNGVNDGGDDDATINDDQFVDVAATGAQVLFTNIVTNTGNGLDIFELAVAPGNFPAGTVFAFFDESGTVPLTDTNGSGPDTGQLASGASKTIIVKATLPATLPAGAPPASYQATVTASSAANPASSDPVTLTLVSITEAVSDLHNAADGAIGSDQNPLDAAPYSAVDTFTGSIGSQVTIPLYIDNESGASDSYVLSVGESWNAGTGTLGALPAGWSVSFYESDGAGSPVGPAITNSPVFPANSVDNQIIAIVSIPNDATLATGDVSIDRDGDGTAEQLFGNGDADGDYPMFFRIVSQNTGATDITLDAIDVDAARALSLSPPATGQIEPGGTLNYAHTLANTGNVSETVELTSSNSQGAFSSTILIDTDGDGTPDTDLGNLVTLGGSTTITVQQPNGVDVIVAVSDLDSDGNPEFVVEPGFTLPLTVDLFAAASAALGQIDSLTITATNDDGTGPSVSIVDQTTVINSQVVLVKAVAVDDECDGTANTGFLGVQTSGVLPGQCAIWRVTAENQGTSNANNVIISDAVTAFSTFESGSLRYCLTNGCAPVTVSDASDGDAGTLDGSNIYFYVGTGATPASQLGGVLVPGEKAVAQFSVRVQ